MKILKNNKILDIHETDPSEALEIINYIKQVGSESDYLGVDELGIEKTVEEEEKYLKAIKETLNNKCFSGRVDGVLVSFCGIHGSNRRKLKHNVSIGMSVLKEYWNLGIGSLMLNHMINYCKITKEIENITLEVRADNQAAIKLYTEAGFKKIGKYSRMFKVDNDYFDVLIMELLL